MPVSSAHGPTLRRVRLVERSGAIRGYRAIDPEAVQRSFQVLLWIDLVHGTREIIEAFESALLDIPDVAPFSISPT